MEKSSRHSKITGDFGEALVLYWLSRSGFECARVDHTGIDLIAKRPRSEERLGVSVKSRSRSPGTESSSVNISRSHVAKVDSACRAFQCIPYFAIVVDATPRISIFLISKERLERIYPGSTRVIAWSMAPHRVDEYLADSLIQTLEFDVRAEKW